MPTLTFHHVSQATSRRLALLQEAAATPASGNPVLKCIGMTLGPQHARFVATDGKMIVSLCVPCIGAEACGPLTLQVEVFTRMWKACAKSRGGNCVRLHIDGPRVDGFIGRSQGTDEEVAYPIPVVPYPYPSTAQVWIRAQVPGEEWVPAQGRYNEHYLLLARKLIGVGSSKILPWASRAPISANLGECDGTQPDRDIPLRVLNALRLAPAYWSDEEMAIMIMPITVGALSKLPEGLSRHG